jgi:hypothetical protein
MDGLIRVLDDENEPHPVITFQRQGLITLTCMKVYGDMVIFRLHFQQFLSRIFQLYKFAFRVLVGQ